VALDKTLQQWKHQHWKLALINRGLLAQNADALIKDNQRVMAREI